MKVCNTCQTALELHVNWTVGAQRRKSYCCSSCSNIKAAAYRAANKEKIKETNRRWYANNTEKAKEKSRKWNEANLDRHAANQRAYRERNVDGYNQYQRDRADTYVGQRLIYAAKARAKKKGLDFDLTIEDISIPTHCPILHIELSRGTKESKDSAPSLDRINPKRGYIKGNVQVISWRANRIKNDASREEVALLLEWFNKQP